LEGKAKPEAFFSTEKATASAALGYTVDVIDFEEPSQ
jgi:hypothetical protein